MHDLGVVDEVPLRQMRLGAVARIRVVNAVFLFGAGGVLAIAFAAGTASVVESSIWAVVGGVALVGLVLTLLPLFGSRAVGTLILASDGVHIRAADFVPGELFFSWSEVERVSTTAIGDGVVFDGRLVAPTFVLILRSGARKLLMVRLRWSVLAVVLGVRSNDRWPPPSRFLSAERIGFNLDCQQREAEALTQLWDARLPRHTGQQAAQPTDGG